MPTIPTIVPNPTQISGVRLAGGRVSAGSRVAGRGSRGPNGLEQLGQGLQQFAGAFAQQELEIFSQEFMDLDEEMTQRFREARRQPVFEADRLRSEYDDMLRYMENRYSSTVMKSARSAIQEARQEFLAKVEAKDYENFQKQQTIALKVKERESQLAIEEYFRSAEDLRDETVLPVIIQTTNSIGIEGKPHESELAQTNFNRYAITLLREEQRKAKLELESELRAEQIKRKDAENVRLDELSTELETSVNAIELEMIDGNIVTREQFDAAVAELEANILGQDPSQKIIRRLDELKTSLITRLSVIRDNAIYEPFISELGYTITDLLRDVSPQALINTVNDAVHTYAREQNLDDNETAKLNMLAMNTLLPEYGEAVDTRWFTEKTMVTNELDSIFEPLHAALKRGEQVDEEQLDQLVTEAVIKAPAHVRDHIEAVVLPVYYNDLDNARTDVEIRARYTQNEAGILERIEAAGANIVLHPGQAQDHFRLVESAIQAADLPELKKQELRDALKETALTSKLTGEATRILDNPSSRPDLGSFVQSAQADFQYEDILGRIPDIVANASREWQAQYNQTSAHTANRFIGDIADQTDASFEQHMAMDINDRDKNKIKEAYRAHNNLRLTAAEFQEQIDNPYSVLSKGANSREMDSWWEHTRGKEGMLEDPRPYMNEFDKVGFMSDNIAKDIWSVVLSGTTDQAQMMLTALSTLRPDTLLNSLSNQQYDQYVFWKYNRKPASPEEAMVALRSYNEPAQTAVRQVLESEYNKMILEEDIGNPETIIDVLDLEDAPADSFGLPYAQRDFQSLHRQFFLRGMDWDDAEDAAKERILKDWGRNINGTSMYLAPSAVGIPTLYDGSNYSHSWVEPQLRRDMAALGVPNYADVRLFADESTRRLHNAGREVSYLVMYTDEAGLVDVLRDNNGNAMRYYPAPDEVATDAAHSILLEDNANFDLYGTVSP